MPQFLEVVRQHISGVVGNVTYCFAVTDIPAVKKFENQLRFDEIIVAIG